MAGFGEAPIVIEGGIADPDMYTWECDCEKCQEKYDNWKKKFDAQQKRFANGDYRLDDDIDGEES